jgi:hypothetical protein
VTRYISLTLLVLFGAGPVGAEEAIPRILHPWGKCNVGAWKVVRVVTQCVDEDGEFTRVNTTETKTTLEGIEDKTITIQISTTREYLGRRFESDGQLFRQGFHGEAADDNLKVKPLEPDTLVIDGRKIPCKVVELGLVGPTGKTTTTLHYSETVAPYVLKRATVTVGPDGKKVVSQSTSEVVAFDMPFDVLSEIKKTAQVRTVFENANGRVVTLASITPDVPGGVVSNSSKETDKEGRLTRLSVLKVVGYSYEPEDERPGLFGRKRPTWRLYPTPPPRSDKPQ